MCMFLAYSMLFYLTLTLYSFVCGNSMYGHFSLNLTPSHSLSLSLSLSHSLVVSNNLCKCKLKLLLVHVPVSFAVQVGWRFWKWLCYFEPAKVSRRLTTEAVATEIEIENNTSTSAACWYNFHSSGCRTSGTRPGRTVALASFVLTGTAFISACVYMFVLAFTYLCNSG